MKSLAQAPPYYLTSKATPAPLEGADGPPSQLGLGLLGQRRPVAQGEAGAVGWEPSERGSYSRS